MIDTVYGHGALLRHGIAHQCDNCGRPGGGLRPTAGTCKTRFDSTERAHQ